MVVFVLSLLTVLATDACTIVQYLYYKVLKLPCRDVQLTHIDSQTSRRNVGITLCDWPAFRSVLTIICPLWLARNGSFPGRCYSNSSYKQLPYQHTPLRSPDACVFNYVCIWPHISARFAYLHGAVSLDTNSRASLNTCTVVHPCLHVRKHIP